MSYALSSSALPRLEDYDTAVAHWHATKPIRGHAEHSWRPLYNLKNPDQRRNRSRWIKLDTHTGEVLCKYHYTEVMTYRPDGAVGIEPYPSVSTGAFFDGLKPDGFGWSSMTHGLGCSISTVTTPDGGYERYQSAHAWLLRRDRKTWFKRDAQGIWQPENMDDLEPIVATRLDKADTREALKDHPYAQFRAWMQTAYGLTPKPTTEQHPYYAWFNSPVELDIPKGERLHWLREGPAAWAEWFTSHERVPSLSSLLEAIRLAIYQYEGCSAVETVVPYPVTYTQLRSIYSTGRKWERRGL